LRWSAIPGRQPAESVDPTISAFCKKKKKKKRQKKGMGPIAVGLAGSQFQAPRRIHLLVQKCLGAQSRVQLTVCDALLVRKWLLASAALESALKK